MMDHLSQYQDWQDSMDYEHEQYIRLQQAEEDYEDIEIKLAVLYALVDEGENHDAEIAYLETELRRVHNILTEYD